MKICTIVVAVVGAGLLWWGVYGFTGIHEQRRVTPHVSEPGTTQPPADMPDTAPAPALPGTDHPAWDAATITWYMRQLKPAERYARVENHQINVITAAAGRAQAAVPSNILMFVDCLFELPYETMEDAVDVLYNMIGSATNALLADYLFCYGTNHAAEQYQLPWWDDDMHGGIDRGKIAFDYLYGLGTPSIVDKCNRYFRQHGAALKRKNPQALYPRRSGIKPDHYPGEARRWLLEYEDIDVRHSMFEAWNHSERPETVAVMDEFLSQIERLPWHDPFWQTELWRPEERPHIKKIALREYRNLRDEYARMYARWIEDEKRISLHYGCYSDDRWEKYSKDPEPTRRAYEQRLRRL